ncbi:MAG: MurR/RpiR family transcriptional regulator [Lachnospiraceae bacterium]|nr:MurR/RpiR family transcriptional regulator [Lachnospiraceae bacterium]
MNPLQKMDMHKESFTQNDLLIYETIRRNPAGIIHMTTSTLADECGVSQPALSRFVKSLGYSRYQDFRTDIVAWLALQGEQEAGGSSHLSYYNTLYAVLRESEALLTDEYMSGLAEYINRFDRIFLTGVGKSFHPAQLFDVLMRKSCRPIQAVSRDYLIEAADYMNENDLLIIFSVSAAAHIMQDSCRAVGKIMLVTANANHDYRERVDQTVLLPYVQPDPESSSVSPILFDVFVELLVSYLLKEKKES